MSAAREWRPGDRVVLTGAPGELARLEGVHGTVIAGGAVALVRFDSAKLLAGRLRREVAVGSVWLVHEQGPPPAVDG